MYVCIRLLRFYFKILTSFLIDWLQVYAVSFILPLFCQFNLPMGVLSGFSCPLFYRYFYIYVIMSVRVSCQDPHVPHVPQKFLTLNLKLLNSNNLKSQSFHSTKFQPLAHRGRREVIRSSANCTRGAFSGNEMNFC